MYINKRRLRPKASDKCVVGIPEPTIWHSKHHVRVVRRDVACQSYLEPWRLLKSMQTLGTNRVEWERRERKVGWRQKIGGISSSVFPWLWPQLSSLMYISWIELKKETQQSCFQSLTSFLSGISLFFLCLFLVHSLVWDGILWLCLQMCMFVGV